MTRVSAKSNTRKPGTAPTILPCNFRSAGRLSNESARTLTAVHEVLARNLTNSLDVYLGTGLEVRLLDLEQLAMDEFKNKCMSAGYLLPCSARPSTSAVLVEMDSNLMFTVIDLLLGGSGEHSEAARELTEIDEEIMEGVGSLIAGQIERSWQPLDVVLEPGKCIKPNMAHRTFPAAEKVLRIHFDVTLAGMNGGLYIAFPASLASHLVRAHRSDQGNGRGAEYQSMPPLRQRILECNFSVSGELPELRVTVRDLARIEEGTVLTLSAPAGSPGQLTLEGKTFYAAAPVGQGNHKAMQLLKALHLGEDEDEGSED